MTSAAFPRRPLESISLGFAAVVVVVGVASVTMSGASLATGRAGESEPSPRCSTKPLPESSGFRTRQGAEVTAAAISGDGARAVVTAAPNPDIPDPDGLLEPFVVDGLTGEWNQLTTSSEVSRASAISQNGQVVAVTSEADLDGDRTAIGEPQVFVGDVPEAAESTFEQVSSGGELGHVAVELSADGNRVLYVQNIGLGFTGGAVRVADLDRDETITVTEDAGQVFTMDPPAISADGTKVVFSSIYDLPDTGPERWQNLFLFDLEARTLTKVAGLGDEGGPFAFLPAFTDDGATVAFSSDGAVLDGVSAGTMRTYLYDIAAATTTLLSDRAPGVELGQLSPDGTRVLARSNADPLGTNPGGANQLFSHDIATGQTAQLTRGSYAPDSDGDVLTWPVAQSTDGNVVAFNTYRNLAGTNPHHRYQAFRVTTCDPPPRPDNAISIGPTGAQVGDDVYSSAPGPAQRQAATLARGQTATFFIEAQNDRTAIDRLTLRGTRTGSPGYRVRYRLGTTDVTAAVRAGAYRSGPLEPGQSVTIKVKITAVNPAAGSGHTVDVTVTSRSNPVARDIVRAKVTLD